MWRSQVGNKRKLIDYLSELEKFLIETSYTSSLRYNGIINKNSKLIDEIVKILLGMGSERLIKGAKEPKIVSKQSGTMFAKWS